jgi:plasmid stabilization system protein ParE
MPYKLIYFDEARLDVREAKAWYKKQKEGLEKRFAQAIKSAIKHLAKMPTANAVRYKNIRIAHPKTFPYAIHYYIDDAASCIAIVAIAHSARHPDVSQGRT